MNKSVHHDANLDNVHSSSCGSIDGNRLRNILTLIIPGLQHDHSGTSLWEHLVGTFEILRAWGVEEDICFAGLIHSIYGTQYFQSELVSVNRRKQIVKATGEYVEQLAHYFCVLDRQILWESQLPIGDEDRKTKLRSHKGSSEIQVSNDILRALRLIDLANETEQRQRYQGSPRSWFSYVCKGFSSIGFIPIYLTDEIYSIDETREQCLLNHYRKSFLVRGGLSKQQLLNCVNEIPQCAEPRLLLATIQLKSGDWVSAYTNARVGVDNIRGWGAAWDTRVPLLAWDLMGSQLMEAARVSSHELPPLAEQIIERLLSASVN